MSKFRRGGAVALAFAASIVPTPSVSEAIGPGLVATVVRDAAGKPVADALVVADGPTRRSGTTGSAGIATLQALPRGSYVLSVTRAGFRTYQSSVTIGAGGDTIHTLDLRLVPSSLASDSDASTTLAPATAADDEPYLAPFVADAADTNLVAGRDGFATVALLGTSANDSRLELDGIPLPNGAGGPALRARDALAATTVDVVPSLVDVPLDTPRDAIGGVVDVHTAPIAIPPTGGTQVGYDGRFGSFQHVAFSQTFARVGIATDDVAGGGEERSQSVKFAFAPSTTTTVGFAAYGAQSLGAVGGLAVVTTEPVYAANLHTALGRATLDAREYRSELTTDLVGAPDASGRIAGTQVALALPFGENVASFGFDRRREANSAGDVASAASFETLDARANVALDRGVRLELGDAYGSGPTARRRHDPHVALAFGTSDRIRVRLAAASAYATAPLAPNVAPETSFGYRASIEARVRGGRAWLAADDVRRRDVFAAAADARSRGIEAGFSRTALPGSLGVLAFARLARATAFGAAQPFARASLAASDAASVPSTNARVAIEYRSRGGIALRLGTTVLGSGNALAPGPLVLGDAGVALPLGDAAEVRFGVRDAFGHPVAMPFANAFGPRTITLTFGRR